MDSLQVDGWTLSAATETEFDELMTWFPNAEAVDVWSGPNFRYPFTRETFLEDCRVDIMDCYALRNPDGLFAAFGQTYEREGRGHLARLVANPELRRQGSGRRLIELIIASLEARFSYDEYSLFVYRRNTAAYRCYQSLGFAVVDYPEDAPMPELCYFLTRESPRLP